MVSGLDNLEAVRGRGWHWLTRLKHSRQVNPGEGGPDEKGSVAVSGGRRVHLKGTAGFSYCQTVAENADTE